MRVHACSWPPMLERRAILSPCSVSCSDAAHTAAAARALSTNPRQSPPPNWKKPRCSACSVSVASVAPPVDGGRTGTRRLSTQGGTLKEGAATRVARGEGQRADRAEGGHGGEAGRGTEGTGGTGREGSAGGGPAAAAAAQEPRHSGASTPAPGAASGAAERKEGGGEVETGSNERTRVG
jgi:hypothetical protein